jgi:sugar phosphate isomerase/epimerase
MADSPEKIDNAFAVISGMYKDAGIPGKPVTEVFAGEGAKAAEPYAKAAQKYNTDVVACIFNPGDNPHLVSPDANERETAIKRLKANIDFAAVAAAGRYKIASGPLYCNHMRNVGKELSQQELGYLNEGMAKAAEYAGQNGVHLALELLNDKETNVLNSVEQGIALRKAVNNEHLGLHLDTIHQKRVEGDVLEATQKALEAGVAYHLHLSDDPRIEYGKGDIGPLTPDLFKMLNSYGYDKAVIIEGFDNSLHGIVGIENVAEDQKDPITVGVRSLKFAVSCA